jgi:hypothetical protein
MENKEKQSYKLKLTDFTPFVGLFDYQIRCLNERYKTDGFISTEEYIKRSFSREMILLAYNSAIIVGTTLGTTGLINLLLNETK